MPFSHLPVGLLGLGTALPGRVMTNFDFEKSLETSYEWIVSRTGIRERRICAAGETAGTLAIEAARNALADAGLKPEYLDLIIACTMTPDALCPTMSCQVHEALGAPLSC